MSSRAASRRGACGSAAAAGPGFRRTTAVRRCLHVLTARLALSGAASREAPLASDRQSSTMTDLIWV